jgi:hypothetical protein
MVLKDAIIDMRPCPCGAVVVAAHLGLRVSRVVADGFLARGRPIWGGIDAADLDAAFRRFGRRLSFVGGCDDGSPPLREFLECRVPLLRAAPCVVWAVDAGEDKPETYPGRRQDSGGTTCA